MAGLGYMAPTGRKRDGTTTTPTPAVTPATQQNQQMTTTMGMPQGAPQAQQNTQPGYQAGNVADYLNQNALTTPNANPYGLPSWAGFEGSGAGQSSGNLFQGPTGWDSTNPDFWRNSGERIALENQMKDWYMPLQTAQANERQNAWTRWMELQNKGSQDVMNAFNMNVTGRQTGLQEWAAQQAAQQAQAQFGLDQNLANWRYGAGGLEERNLNNQRYATDQEGVRQQMIGNQQMSQIGAKGTQERLLQQMIGGQQSQQIGEKGSQERLTQEVVNKGMLAQQALANTGNLTVQQQRDLAEMQRLQGSVNSISFGREQLGEQSRASKATEALKATQLQNELMAARYAAYGRQQAPTAQWQRGWG